MSERWSREKSRNLTRFTCTEKNTPRKGYKMNSNELSNASATEEPRGGSAEVDSSSKHGSKAAEEVVSEPVTAVELGERQYHRTISISEAADETSGGWNAPFYIRWLEIPFRVKNPIDGSILTEATGWAMDLAARGPMNQLGGLVGSAVLKMASIDAGCGVTEVSCDNTIYGIKPSSLLTTASAVVGIVAAIMMPLVGAITDHTPYRKHIGLLSGLFCVALTGLEISISEERNNWLFILIVDSLQSFCLIVHVTAVFAYLPDLTNDESIIPHYTSHFIIRQYSTQLIYTFLIIAAGFIRGTDKSVGSSIFTARTAAGIAFGYALILVMYSWTFLLRKRPPLSKVPEGQTLVNTGFLQLQKTTKKIWSKYHSLRWFLFSLLWSPDAGAGMALSIAVSFFVTDMKFSGQQMAIVTLLLILGNCPGALVSKLLCRLINPLNTYRTGFVFLSSMVILAVVHLDSPDKEVASYIFSFIWGFGMGWVFPSQRVLYCTLIPKGQETEMMGLFSCVSQIFGWLPPLIVTIMNENDIKFRFGLLVIPFFSLFSVLCTLPMGNYKTATEQVQKDSEEKLKEVLKATGYQTSLMKPEEHS